MAKTETVKTEILNQYEGMFLLPPAASTDLDAAIKLVRGIIEKHAGQIMVIKKWDERKLAYEVLRQKRGLYILAYFKAPGAAITAIERDVNLSDDVLRLLVTTADYLNEAEMAAVEPQPIQPREERNPWDRPDDRGPRDGPRRDDGPRDGPRRDDRAPSYDRGPRDDRAPAGDRGVRDDRAPRAPRRDDIPSPMAKD